MLAIVKNYMKNIPKSIAYATVDTKICIRALIML